MRSRPQIRRKYKATLDYLFDSFGEDKLVFGSDWLLTERPSRTCRRSYGSCGIT